MKIVDVAESVPVLLCDGIPGKSPHFLNPLEVAIQHFEKYIFDVLLVPTFITYKSAYTNVERGMAPLCKALPSVFLSPNTCGTHLEMVSEKRNFKEIGDILHWNQFPSIRLGLLYNVFYLNNFYRL